MFWSAPCRYFPRHHMKVGPCELRAPKPEAGKPASNPTKKRRKKRRKKRGQFRGHQISPRNPLGSPLAQKQPQRSFTNTEYAASRTEQATWSVSNSSRSPCTCCHSNIGNWIRECLNEKIWEQHRVPLHRTSVWGGGGHQKAEVSS